MSTSCDGSGKAAASGVGLAVAGLFGLSSFFKSPVNNDQVTELQNQIKENAEKMQAKILDARFKLSDDQYNVALATIGEYRKSEELVTTVLQQEITNSYVLIYGLIVITFIIYLYLLLKK